MTPEERRRERRRAEDLTLVEVSQRIDTMQSGQRELKRDVKCIADNIEKYQPIIERLREDLDAMIEEHTDPTTGARYDVRAAYSSLERIARDAAMARVGVWIFGAIAPFAVGLGIYEFTVLRDADKDAAQINLEQTIMIERSHVILQHVVDQLAELRRLQIEQQKRQ